MTVCRREQGHRRVRLAVAVWHPATHDVDALGAGSYVVWVAGDVLSLRVSRCHYRCCAVSVSVHHLRVRCPHCLFPLLLLPPQSARAGDTSLVLAAAVDWRAGEEVVLTPTEYATTQLETATIASVSSNGRVVTLTKPLLYTHGAQNVSVNGWGERNVLGGGSPFVHQAAAVGLLSRNVRIIGADADVSGWGAHIVVGSLLDSAGAVSSAGVANLSYVECRLCGKLGSEYGALTYDYRTAANPRSVVRGNAFPQSLNSAIVAARVAGLVVVDNVVHRAFRTAIRIDASVRVCACIVRHCARGASVCVAVCARRVSAAGLPGVDAALLSLARSRRKQSWCATWWRACGSPPTRRSSTGCCSTPASTSALAPRSSQTTSRLAATTRALCTCRTRVVERWFRNGTRCTRRWWASLCCRETASSAPKFAACLRGSARTWRSSPSTRCVPTVGVAVACSRARGTVVLTVTPCVAAREPGSARRGRRRLAHWRLAQLCASRLRLRQRAQLAHHGQHGDVDVQ
jgi:hypothetical protein